MQQHTQEQWKPIPGFEGRYEISNYGRVKSMPREIWGGKVFYTSKERILKNVLKPQGYYHVALRDGDQSHKRYIHDLVLTVFVGPRPSERHYARHLDDVKTNNHVNNLAWGTPSENSFDKVRNGNDHYASRDRCKNGHLFTEDNIYRRAKYPGTRYCKQCRAEATRARYQKNLERKRAWRAQRRAQGMPVT